MREVLNSVIKFDLHIHSIASKYKEDAGIVDQSTKENIEVLLTKLNHHNVALFSITDHNRFDPDIYIEVNNILSQPDHPYNNVKAILAGVEFDIIIDENMSKCHIITIFDTNSEAEKFRKIDACLQSDLLNDKQEAYTKSSFERILKEIGLNTILIASQRKDINNKSGNHNSLSDSTQAVEEIIRVGYINALEFQKPKVEGILLNNLKSISLPIALFSGSDCHDWDSYPYHDSRNQNREFFHSKAKILPTFKGLLMAVTSPETRFNCSENTNISIIDNLKIGGKNIPLVNGINAVIGENGSGKTTLLKLINGKTSETHVKKIISDNMLESCSSISPKEIKYIEQGQIVKKFNDKTLFSAGDGSHFVNLDFKPFRDAYSVYSETLKKGIEAQINKQENLISLSRYKISFEANMIDKNYFVNIIGNENADSSKNPHDKALSDITALFIKLNALLSDEYFTPYKDKLTRTLQDLTSIKDEIQQKWNSSKYEANVKNILHSCVDDYLRKKKANSSAKDREISEYAMRKRQVVNAVTTAVKLSIEEVAWPAEPCIYEGVTKNPKQGFSFNREAAYNCVSMIDNFYSKMFVKDYGCFNRLQTINSYEKFAESIRNCTSISDISSKWSENFEKFIADSVKTSDYIMDSAAQQIGNTLGEMSLSYYKFFTQDDQDWRVLIVDQPEDNISNNNISRKLISYFNAIRDGRQIIFVTHNPLLVVNLDVDNVIYMINNSGKIDVRNGCLEYEDEHTNILDLVAQNMDGGKETIEKRLKVYGKSN